MGPRTQAAWPRPCRLERGAQRTERFAAQPTDDLLATTLFTASRLVPPRVLRAWCSRYVMSHDWFQSEIGTPAPRGPAGVERAISNLRHGFGRSAAAELESCVRAAPSPRAQRAEQRPRG